MSVRIGNCSGFYGDRLSAMREMLEGGDLDYLTGDYLAELTMLILGRDVMKDASLGYAKTFVKQMTECIAIAKEKGVKIVANAGGLNTAALADKLKEIDTQQGLRMSIAHIEGDDLKPRADELGWNGALTANAYLGAFGIAEALNAGADIVVTGRVTDASVVLGPAIAHHGWGREDFDQLAGAVVAGHIIECGTQATGGNFAGFKELLSYGHFDQPLGFPIAEIDPDGSFVITKHEGTGGAVTVDTVTAQLVYEIQGEQYLNPDVTTHFSTIQPAQAGPDRVRVSGVKGSPPPASTKVCLNFFGGFRNDAELIITGLDQDEKVALLKAQVEQALQARADAGFELPKLEWTFNRSDVPDPVTQEAGTSVLRVHAESTSPEPVGRDFSNVVIELALASLPGFAASSSPPAPGRAFGFYKAGYLPQADVPHVVVLADGTRLEIAPPANVVDQPGVLDGDHAVTPSTELSAETVRAPLGGLAYARSGDKGGDANIGVWIPSAAPNRDAAVAWLIDLLTPERIRELLPETADLGIEVYPLPNLGGLNILVRGILGQGVAASARLDPQAKALGEWLRARHVDIPVPFLWGEVAR
ncbi:MAG TPA: acyclic terpene utilization AtuA family protein [Aeromicrobium sp.]|nr:acyclic terpene utilization AtuA family protein [Aeromicrobium sp.]